MVVKQDAHAGYITWTEYLHNQDTMRQNMARMGSPHRGAPREGPAVLSGLLVCGRCGRRMTANYSGRERTYFTYVCAGDRDGGVGSCWTVPGAAVDAAIDQLFLAMMVPDELELCLAVERDVQSHAAELDRAWQLTVDVLTWGDLALRLKGRRRLQLIDDVWRDVRVRGGGVEREREPAAAMPPEHARFDDDQIVVRVEAANLHRQRTKSIACARTRPVKKWPTSS